jgi:hypothetical protein
MSGALRRAGHIPLGTLKGVGRVLGKSSSTPMPRPASPSSMIAIRRLWPPISNRPGLALPRGERRPTAACPRRSRLRIARHPRPPRMRTPPRRQEHRSSLRQPFDHASLGGTFGWLRPHQARSPQITGIVERYRNTMIDAFHRIAFREKIHATIDDQRKVLDVWTKGKQSRVVGDPRSTKLNHAPAGGNRV